MKDVATHSHFAACLLLSISLLSNGRVLAHENTLAAFLKARRVEQTKAVKGGKAEGTDQAQSETCQLKIKLTGADKKVPVHGLVRITDLAQGKSLPLTDLIKRESDWYVATGEDTVSVPQTEVRIEAFQGLETEMVAHVADLAGRETASVHLELPRFYNASAKGLLSGNTHLHLKQLTSEEAERYLRLVPQADNLDLVSLSFLRRIPEEIGTFSPICRCS